RQHGADRARRRRGDAAARGRPRRARGRPDDLGDRREAGTRGGVRDRRHGRGDRRAPGPAAGGGPGGARGLGRRGDRGEPGPRRAVPRWEGGRAQRGPRPGDEEVRWLGQPEGRPRAAPPAPVWVLIRRPVRVDRRAPKRYPWGQLILVGLVAMVEALFRPLARMWRSDDPLDTYGLAHFGSVAGGARGGGGPAGGGFFQKPPPP